MNRIAVALFTMLASLFMVCMMSSCTAIFSEAAGLRDVSDTEYTITWNMNGGTWANGYTGASSFLARTTVVLPTAAQVVRTGYTFKGWYESAGFSGSAVTGWSAGQKKADVAFYAKWAANKAVITVSAPVYSDVDLALTQVTEGTVTTFTVDSGYKSYVWYYDGSEVKAGESNTWTLDSAGTSPVVNAGKHQILVVVTESDKIYSYSATCTYTYTVTE